MGASSEVRQRVAFYIPGFDPYHPRRYRELYRREGADQAQISGYDLRLTPTAKGESFGWRVEARIEGAEVDTRFEVLVWHDLVKEAMPNGILSTYVQMARTAWIYFGSGAIWPMLSLRKGPVIATFYPIVVLLGQFLLALGLGWLVVRLLGIWAPWWLAALPGAAAFWLLMRWFKRIDGKVFAHYLIHDYAYGTLRRGANPPDLEARLTRFRARIRAALDTPGVDEVLVIGHSSGAHLGVSVLADLLREGWSGDRLSFLTLGQAVPMMSFLPDAHRLRRDLHLMGGQDHIPWVDVSAPSDGCTFALCDPVGVTGVAPEGHKWPLVLSAAFTQTLSPARQAVLKWRFFRRHFQYLCAFDALPDSPDAYDYFRITAGPLRLWTRMRGRAPSPSRLTKATSKYRSLQE